ncbi:hypothetical protein GJAV_G00195100, partial [Gymnothorax javanicus]
LSVHACASLLCVCVCVCVHRCICAGVCDWRFCDHFSMNTLHRSIFFYQLLLHLGTVCEDSAQTLCRRTGESVTLPCYYDIKYHGPAVMCWGRAKVPASKCSNTIVRTDGENLTWRESERYQLQSGVMNGNVSLTIINVTEQDSGIYGCRVEIPGWFNDLKSHFHLTVVKDDGETERSTTTENTPDKPTAEGRSTATANATESSALSTAHPTEAQLSSGYSSQTDLQSPQEDSRFRHKAGIIIPLIVVLFLAAMLLFILWQKKKNKTQFFGNAQINQPSSGSFTTSVPTLETTDRETAVENIYQ